MCNLTAAGKLTMDGGKAEAGEKAEVAAGGRDYIPRRTGDPNDRRVASHGTDQRFNGRDFITCAPIGKLGASAHDRRINKVR